MSDGALFWLGVTLICIAVQSFYSMLEMACVSFNKVRLQYYVNEGKRRALWLNYLLENPARLFGTTLVGVNVALQIGSECSRQFYSALNLSPDIAPLTQVVLVLIFAELAPMFAARRYAEHVALLGIPIIYASSVILRPITWSFTLISRVANWILGQRDGDENIFITRDELQKVFEDSEEDGASSSGKDFNTVVANIFSLRSKTAGQTMDPLSMVPMLPSHASVSQMRGLLKSSEKFSFIAIYHRTRRNVVGISFPRDLLKVPDSHCIMDHARPPWFLTRSTRIFRVLKQFRLTGQSVAVVLSDKGSAIGVLTLDGILSEIFGKVDYVDEAGSYDLESPQRHIERTFTSDLEIADFNMQFDADLPTDSGATLLELMTTHLGHEPTKGETVRLESYELEVIESPLLGEKKITIRTRPK